MKALKCELCGSIDVVKQDGLFVCQHCGTKYSVEEAKKMMVEGTVKIDDSTELKNLYEIARRAKDSDNNEQAEKYYDKILVKDPSSWEANFYVVYFKAMSCRVIEISNAATSVANCISPVLGLVKDNVHDDEEQSKVINEIYLRSVLIANMLSAGSQSHLDSIDNYEIRCEYKSEHLGNASEALKILMVLAGFLSDIWGDKYEKVSADCYKEAASLYALALKSVDVGDEDSVKDVFGEFVPLIQKYYPDYQLPILKKKATLDSLSNTSSSTGGGCYVATAVYGSYNCPEVWTLRRFRDNTLDATWYGRAFIQTYYAISPTLVKWFGETLWFKKLWLRPLDKLVTSLKSKGVEDTPYQDKY